MQVVSDLVQFLASLRGLRAAYGADGDGGWRRLYPAHGQVIDSRAAARAKLDEYIAHRRARVLQVVAALRAAGAGTPLTVEQIVERVYPVCSDGSMCSMFASNRGADPKKRTVRVLAFSIQASPG